MAKGLEIYRRNLPDNLNFNKEVNSFIRRNNNHWQKELEKRKDVYYKFTRNTFTMNEKEKNIYLKLDLTKLKTEIEILTTRREYKLYKR